MKRNECCRVIISAPFKKEAYVISKSLVQKKLVAGTIINKGDCHYWWSGKVVAKEYYNVETFSLLRHKERIISDVKRLHSDRCPIIAFHEIDGNKEFLNWIRESVL